MGFWPRQVEAPAVPAGPVVDWEEARCLLCGSGRLLIEGADQATGSAGLWFAVVQCQECGLCFTNPRPTREAIGQFYPSDYRPHQLSRKPPRGRTWKERLLRPLARDERKVLP